VRGRNPREAAVAQAEGRGIVGAYLDERLRQMSGEPWAQA